MEAISLPPDYPPSEIWLIHDFMSLSKNEMKYIYKELIREGFIVETFFNNKNEIKKIAFEKKIEFCLINNKVISTI